MIKEPLSSMSTLIVQPIPALNDNYIWMIIHPKKQVCVVVDPGDATPALNVLAEQQLKLAGILITHHHWDHTNGIDAIIAAYPAPVFAPYSEHIPQATQRLKQGDKVSLSNMSLSLDVIETPGHTVDHICYYGHGCLFSGDTLFTGGCGRLFEGTAEHMYRSLKTLAALPSDTLVYCGHEYTENNLRFAEQVEPNNPDLKDRIHAVFEIRKRHQPTVPASLAIEKKTNPFLRCDQLSVKAMAEKQVGHSLGSPVDVLTEIRKWKDR